MSLEVTELTSPEQFERWNAYVADHPGGTFLQLESWARLKQQFGWDYHVLVATDEGEIAGGAVMMDRKAPMGQKFSYVPYGPLWNAGRDDVLEELLVELKRESQGSVGLRVEPYVAGDKGEWRREKFIEILGKEGFVASGKALQPEATLLLDLKLSEEDLLAGMRQTTRRYIRKAEKLGLRIEVDTTGKRLDEFYAILKAVDDRKQFGVHTFEYYQAAWQVLRVGRSEAGVSPTQSFGEASRRSGSEKEEGKRQALSVERRDDKDASEEQRVDFLQSNFSSQPYLFFVIDGEVVVGSYFLTQLGNKSWELYGGVIDEGMQKKANYLLKWEAIRAMKLNGVEVYDQWGVAPILSGQGQGKKEKGEVVYDQRHHMAGVTYFKEGFGGERVEYIGGWDYAHKAWLYHLARLLKKL